VWDKTGLVPEVPQPHHTAEICITLWESSLREGIMRLYARFFVTAAVLTAALALYGQEQQRKSVSEQKHSSGPNLLVRLAFDSGGWLSPGSQNICLAVDQDGNYRMMRTNAGLRMIGTLDLDSAAPINQDTSRSLLDPTERLEGRLSAEQLQQLKILVGSSDLRTLAGNHVALIRQSAETFTAEIPVLDKQVSDGTLHVHLLDADGESPFPEPARKIVDWLNHFEPKNAKTAAALEFRDVCPGGGLQLVQPAALSAR
jgi:hypothetical protein